MSLKQKTVNGITWSFIENISRLGSNFIIGIILARILSPREFGLIGILMIFTALSQSLINSGFTQALIRKQDCSQIDYSTVFYFNIAASLSIYFLVFLLANEVAIFFEEPVLKDLIKVFSFVIVINSLSIVQKAILTKRLDFKLLTKVSVISSVTSGIIAIILAHLGYGVWSLVVKIILEGLFALIMFLIWNKWYPSLEFSRKSFNELFSFGSKLLFVGLIDTAYKNIYYIVIGKYFSPSQLGFFTRAEQFSNLFSQNISGVIQRVSFPVLSTLQHNIDELRSKYRSLIIHTMYITFFSMFLLAASAESVILTLIGEKWLGSVEYLQLLCFVGVFYPLHSLNLNMLQVKGRSDLSLYIELIKKTLAIPVIIIGIYYGIIFLIYGMIIHSILAYFINSLWGKKLINYGTYQQMKDLFPIFVIMMLIGITVFLFGLTLELSPLIEMFLQTLLGFALLILLSIIFKIDSFFFLVEILKQKIKYNER